MIDSLLQRANQLIQLKRFDEAEKELRQVLSVDPDRAEALALMAICQSEQKHTKEAINFVRQAIARQPDNDFFLYLLAFFQYKEDELKEAEKTIRNAIAFAPQNAEYFGLLALICIGRKEWEAGLENANQGLSIDPDNLTCLNARSKALFKLNKKEEAYSTIEEALSKDPENEVTHTNVGWGLLERGDHAKALEHFREALKINPDYPYAKAGLVAGLKARYWFYRIFLRYAFWVSNLKGKGQWFMIIGLYVGIRLLDGVAETNPTLAIFLKPIVYLYLAFAISTWLLEPLSNLFLRLNVYGRYALKPEEIRSSNFVALALTVGAMSALGLLLIDSELLFMTMIFGLTMMIPLASMFNPRRERNRQILVGYTILLATVGLLAIGLQATTGAPGALVTAYIIGVIAYQWIANAMIIRT